jgi:DNA repair protein RecO (recombination protein O)
MDAAHALFAVAHISALTRLLPERDPHPGLYDAMGVVLDRLDDAAVAAALVVRYELEVLKELGFGLDLSACAATGGTDDLIYVSPKSGRALSRQAGEPWKDRLLPLPDFLKPGGAMPGNDEVAGAFRLTGHFLLRDVYGPRGLALPEARAAFLAALSRSR